jgi:hypothetical protein
VPSQGKQADPDKIRRTRIAIKIAWHLDRVLITCTSRLEGLKFHETARRHQGDSYWRCRYPLTRAPRTSSPPQQGFFSRPRFPKSRRKPVLSVTTGISKYRTKFSGIYRICLNFKKSRSIFTGISAGISGISENRISRYLPVFFPKREKKPCSSASHLVNKAE